ncbi:hypothetical protein EJ08DRAFT_585251 [Tothia fuscella]|uniref:RRM domain-containing protein n=1 Tax=Tothia fuscella TaxID=1048955 RepID=A0A9P4U0C8_9PEZI|nr:hypothetical protein EJ08DRAFT_585251 [Tothia fuscella]
MAGAYGHGGSQAAALRAAPYMQGNMLQHSHSDASMAALANGFGAMNMSQSPYAPASRASSQVASTASEYGGVPLSQAQAQAMYLQNQSQYLYPQAHMMSATTSTPGASIYTPVGPYMQPVTYAGYTQHMVDNSPQGQQNWTPRMASDTSSHVPHLVTPSPRRDSVSSNEEHLPATPYGVGSYAGYHNGVTVMDRSPSGVFTHSGTPSPSQFMQSYVPHHMGKQSTASQIPLALQMLIAQEPVIPRAIPAVNSPMKPLDRCLENKNGETNVYIRGLLPETTDDMLYSWGVRFGDIQSSKSIIDLKTNFCKGFGFIKYHNFEDAENCIRGFHFLGYEVSFARESFYAKLKKFSDESNTNLYVSNIPRTMNEHELSLCFEPFKVCSARILRDDGGNGRGVGFARFETRDICEDVIKSLNNTPVSKPGGEEHIMQIRYSDTHEQKMLKQQTAAARQFRATEFEYGCIEARRTGLLLPPPDRMHSVSPPADHANEFETFLQQTNNAQG